jgi:hypothetical protein
MENNFTSTQHLRDANGNAVMESAGRTIAKLRERQRGRNFVYGVIISAFALTTAIMGVALGTTNRYANDLRTKLDAANGQITQMSQRYSASTDSITGARATDGTTAAGYSTAVNDTTDSTTTDSRDKTTAGNTRYETGTRNWRSTRNWRNYNDTNNNNNNVAPAYSPSAMDYNTPVSATNYGTPAGGFVSTAV